MPLLLTTINDKIKSHQIEVFNRKFAKGTDLLNIENGIGPYYKSSTPSYEFVQALSKHLKIVTICHSGEDMKNCFPEKVTTFDLGSGVKLCDVVPFNGTPKLGKDNCLFKITSGSNSGKCLVPPTTTVGRVSQSSAITACGGSDNLPSEADLKLLAESIYADRGRATTYKSGFTFYSNPFKKDEFKNVAESLGLQLLGLSYNDPYFIIWSSTNCYFWDFYPDYQGKEKYCSATAYVLCTGD